MVFETSILAVLALVAAWTSSLAAALVGPRRREAPGALELFWLLLAAALWSFGAAVELSVPDLSAKIAWSRVQYLGTLAAPPLFFLFAARFARTRWFSRPLQVAAIFCVPALTYLLALTNERHQLIWTSIRLSTDGTRLAVFHRASGFWLGVVGYSYLCLAAGTALLIRAALRHPRALRKQAIVLLAGAAIPWTANASYLFGYFPLRDLDPTPLSIAAMGIVCCLAILRYGLVDLVPAAREAAVREMADGLIVLDTRRRVIDVNPAARRLLGRHAPPPGSDLDEVFAAAGLRPAAAKAPTSGPSRIEVDTGGGPPRVLEVEVTAFHTSRGLGEGSLVQLHDATDLERTAGELRSANELLQGQLREIEALHETLREQAVRDPLTGLFNRRYLDETLGRELARAERSGEPLALVLLDLDHLKELNDLHGHAAGDDVLRDLGLLLRARTRRSDIACRHGGDEFLVVMPATDLETARVRAEDLCASFAAHFTPSRLGIAASLSAGVACFPTDAGTLESLLANVDLALYAAKRAGRNRVFCAG